MSVRAPRDLRPIAALAVVVTAGGIAPFASACAKSAPATGEASSKTELTNGLVVSLGGDEGKLTLPADAKVERDVSPLPPNLLKSTSYSIASRGVLQINVGKPDPREVCDTLLQKNYALVDAARKDARTASVARITVLESRHIGGHDAVYTEAETRTVADSQNGGEYRPGIGYVLCTKSSFVNLTLREPDGHLTPRDHEILDGIAASLTY